jgi:hypothetical protein
MSSLKLSDFAGAFRLADNKYKMNHLGNAAFGVAGAAVGTILSGVSSFGFGAPAGAVGGFTIGATGAAAADARKGVDDMVTLSEIKDALGAARNTKNLGVSVKALEVIEANFDRWKGGDNLLTLQELMTGLGQ